MCFNTLLGVQHKSSLIFTSNHDIYRKSCYRVYLFSLPFSLPCRIPFMQHTCLLWTHFILFLLSSIHVFRIQECCESLVWNKIAGSQGGSTAGCSISSPRRGMFQLHKAVFQGKSTCFFFLANYWCIKLNLWHFFFINLDHHNRC